MTSRQVPDPTPGPGRAVVEVAAVSLNRGEVQHVRAHASLAQGAPVGWDVAGTVLQAATDGSGPPQGARVFGWSDSRGSWADRVAMRTEHLAIAPDGLTMVDASTLGVAGLTAWAALRRHAPDLSAQTVLVTGATGGVGLLACQLAAAEGAQVIASLRDPAGAPMVHQATGVELTIEQGIDPSLAPVDLVVESVGGAILSAALRRVAPRGSVVSLGRTTIEDASVPSGWFLRGATLHGLSFSQDYGAPGATVAALDHLARMVVDGRLRTNVTMVCGPDDLVDAMDALIERRVHGKVVVDWRV